MIVRVENIKNSDILLVIDELGRYIGTVTGEDFFTDCIIKDKEEFEEDDYLFFHVDKKCLSKYLKK